MKDSRRLRRWLALRRDDWTRMAAEVRGARQGRLSDEAARRAVADYRSVASDLAYARRDLAGTDVVPRLESLLHQLHVAIHSRHEPWREQARRLYLVEVPALFARLRPILLAVVAIFVGSGAAGWLLVAHAPEMGGLFLSEEMINGVQRGELWTEGLLNVIPSSLISTQIVANNVVVSLTAFVLGAFYGLGTLYIVVLNGAMLGGTLAFVSAYGLREGLLRFIVAHGVVELSVVMITAAAGVQLGEALARPGNRTRAEAFRSAVADGARLLCVLVPALFVAGLIEGYVSPNPTYDWPVRIGIGIVSGWLLWVVLSGRLARSRAS